MENIFVTICLPDQSETSPAKRFPHFVQV